MEWCPLWYHLSARDPGNTYESPDKNKVDTVAQPISVCDLSRQTEVDLSEENWIVWVADIQQLSGLILCSTTIMVTSSSHVSCVVGLASHKRRRSVQKNVSCVM